MRKLIEKQQNSIIVCDNPKCDYEVYYTYEHGLVLWTNHVQNVAKTSLRWKIICEPKD